MFRFCKESGIPLQVCGKVVVATRPDEIPALETLYQRGLANGVRELALIGPERLRELEPHARGGAGPACPFRSGRGFRPGRADICQAVPRSGRDAQNRLPLA